MARRLISIGLLALLAAPVGSQQPAILQAGVKLAQGEVIVVNVPVKKVGSATEWQVCFIWRDKEFKTASLQCPNDKSHLSFDGP